MYNILFLDGFNNYYNRVVKKLNSLTDYDNWITENNKLYSNKSGVNFVPNDGVNTELVINWSNNWYPDYLVVQNENTGELSRWFVIESQRTRGEQYKILLRRDLIVDFYDNILDADIFVEKATLNPDDPLIFNNEDMTFNQIKKGEWFLRDKTDSAWIVGYYDKTRTEKNEGDTYSYEVELGDEIVYDTSATKTYSDWIVENQNRVSINETKYIVNARTGPNTSYKNWKYTVYGSQGFANRKEIQGLQSLNTKRDDVLPEQLYNAFNQRGFADLDEMAKNYEVGTISSQNQINELLNFQNKIVRFPNSTGTGFEYYRITIYSATYENSIYSVRAGNLYNEMTQIALSLFNDSDSAPDSNSFKVSFSGSSYRVSSEKISTGKFRLGFDIGQYSLRDAPYGMFAIPYPINTVNLGDMIINNTGNAQHPSITINKDLSYRIAAALSTKYSTGGNNGPIYDIQLLPYCPIPSIVQADDTLDLKNDNLLFRPIEKIGTNNTVESWDGVVLFASSSSFTIDIPFTNINLGNVKIGSQVTMCRLSSPNYNGQFEFNPYKNNGIRRFNVDCTYKPFQPYIHLNPDFGGLYGEDFNDCRGLICGGDFSLPRITDAWESYQLQNKNFQEIFDRQIQNMEINNKYQKISDIASAAAGTLSGAAAGGFLSNTMGAGAGPGMIIGGLASGIAGLTDVQIKEALRNEAIDFTKDQFGYQLGNIQALPQSISKTTAFTYNNKIYPIIEFYSCTDREIIALAKKIAFNGMTVMAIGKLSDYIDNTWEFKDGDIEIKSRNYFKGKLIRIEGISDDFHIINEIASEINKGVFL